MESTSRARTSPRTRDRKEHETEFTRIVAFTDGVLAIAITLLVLNLEVPDVPDSQLADRLVDLWPQLLAYVLSFAVIARFWFIHHQFFGSLARFDSWLVSRNLLYLALVVLVPFTTEVLGEYGNQSVAVAVYAAIMALAALVNWSMLNHAVRHDLIREEERAATQAFGARAALGIPAVFALSIPIAFVSPTAAELFWLVAFVARQRRVAARGR
jgi:uncharacterized membrane protein